MSFLAKRRDPREEEEENADRDPGGGPADTRTGTPPLTCSVRQEGFEPPTF